MRVTLPIRGGLSAEPFRVGAEFTGRIARCEIFRREYLPNLDDGFKGPRRATRGPCRCAATITTTAADASTLTEGGGRQRYQRAVAAFLYS